MLNALLQCPVEQLVSTVYSVVCMGICVYTM